MRQTLAQRHSGLIALDVTVAAGRGYCVVRAVADASP
ncbi:hypothetical protein BCF44_1281 [Kutzneria buriramensis]|uniref:Uncharacterized protein n=1 Tax=Kutzneria buriramensis TaxID=1045776 RepID=A0A3E0GU20_9PSEU|nr:hypothetical protein BCF44_1281 [Kutzneria buriramensis]